MTRTRMRVEVGGVRLRVPLSEDRETTLRIVEKVNHRLEEIEHESQRIDTQAFALQAAFSFAAQVEDMERDKRNDTSEMLVALDKLSESLKALLDDFPPRA